MKNISLHYDSEDLNDRRSLIEIIISRLGSSIQSMETYHDTVYRVHDWVYVLGEYNEIDRRQPWVDLKGKLIEHRIIYPAEFETIEQKDNDGSIQITDFASEKMLYFITQYMVVTNTTSAVRKYLANAGVFLDGIRRNPEVAYDAMRESFAKQGKEDDWIETRIDGIINRHKFINILKAVVRITLEQKDYGTATNDLYIGLWKRTKEMLIEQMDLPRNQNLRDNQSRLALLFEGIAEEVCAAHLGQKKDVNWFMARAIIQETASKVGKYVDEVSEDIGMDIPTGIKLNSGHKLPHLDGSGMLPDNLRIQIPRKTSD